MKSDLRNKYLLKNTIIFFIGNFGSKILQFLLVPFYTNILSTSEYGTLDLINVINMVLIPLITFNISESIMRFSMDKDSDKNKILSIGILIFMFSILISFILLPIFNKINYFSEYSILFVLFIISTASSTLFLCYIRGIEKLLDYAFINIFQTFCITSLNIFFLLYLKTGIEGYIISYIISNFLTTVLCFFRGNIIKSITKICFDKALFIKMIKYSLLLIPNSLMWWIMNSLDRVMITNMINIESNGIYAISSKIPTILITLTTIFNQAWMFSAVKEKDSTDKNLYTNKIFNGLSTCVITMAGILLLFLKPLLSIYVGNSFYEAWKYTPPLLVGTIFLTLSTFLSNEYTAHKDSMGFLKSSSIGAFINLFLNLLLIPILGILGASLSTCISYICVFIFRVFDTKKYVSIKIINLKRIVNLIILIMMSFINYIEFDYVYIFQLILVIIILLINKNFWHNIINTIYIKIFKERKIKNEI